MLKIKIEAMINTRSDRITLNFFKAISEVADFDPF